ncbi:hypothetical protein ACH5RR_010509 [Cinchona calisaya]|uniref:Uncharacterized protein n=1 Tax=Cinchona calisaya TaxID=153742 RepID=A0ABD3AJ41_9GENT
MLSSCPAKPIYNYMPALSNDKDTSSRLLWRQGVEVFQVVGFGSPETSFKLGKLMSCSPCQNFHASPFPLMMISRRDTNWPKNLTSTDQQEENNYALISSNANGGLVQFNSGASQKEFPRFSSTTSTKYEATVLAIAPECDLGRGFANGTIKLGEIEVCQITKFEFIWGCNLSRDRKQGVSFYKPVEIPDGFFSLGHYCQSIEKPFRGFFVVAREVFNYKRGDPSICNPHHLPALKNPEDYTLIWRSDDGSEEHFDGCGYFWLPQPSEGYKALGFAVTNKPEKPKLEEFKCVRADLTDECEVYQLLVNTASKFLQVSFGVWSTRPRHRGMLGRGVSSLNRYLFLRQLLVLG